MATAQWNALLVAACLAVSAACDDSSSGSTTVASEPADAQGDGPLTTEDVVLRSADGVVELVVPAGTVREADTPSIEVVDPGLVGDIDGAVPIGPAYRLEPDDVVFAEPVAVTFRLPVADIAADAGIPLLVAAIEAGGLVRRAADQRTEPLDVREVSHRAWIDRFGTLVLLDGGLTFELDPGSVDGLMPGEGFDAELVVAPVAEVVGQGPGYDAEMRWRTSGVLSGPPTDSESATAIGAGGSAEAWTVTASFTCDGVGGGSYTAEILVDVPTSDPQSPSRQLLVVPGEANCGDVGR